MDEASFLFPPKPEEPLDSECCGTGCTPCVFDIYKEKQRAWEEDCEQILTGLSAPTNTKGTFSSEIISPCDYASYIINEIVEDCLFCKIISFRRNGTDRVFGFNRKKFPVKLGQHVVLKIEGKTRQYTVLDVKPDGSFTIIFKIYENGHITQLVNKLVAGNLVEMRGPFGKEIIYSANTYTHLVMIAAGTGIAPFYRIIGEVLENDSDETRILLLYACHDENQIMLLGKMKEWSRSWNFKVLYFISNVQDKNKAQGIHYGMKVVFGKIDKTVISNLPEVKIDNSRYYICGTKSFDKDMLNYLKSAGINEDKIKLF